MILYIKEFYKALQEANKPHLQDFGWGDFHKFWSDGARYPFLNVFSSSKNFEKGFTRISLTISIMDIVRENDSNLDNVEDKTLAILRDVYNITKSNLGNKKHIKVGEIANIEFFKTRGGDVVAGHTMSLDVTFFDSSGLCETILLTKDFCCKNEK